MTKSISSKHSNFDQNLIKIIWMDFDEKFWCICAGLKVFEHLRTSVSTLSSLSKLLDEIENIVIRDEINELIETSVSNIDQAFQSINLGDIESAMRYSKVAFECSEKAFHDWSLLALLYFPDDQKYAIYVPLFLPISLPLFLSFFNAVKFLRQKK